MPVPGAFMIADRPVGQSERPFVIGEVASGARRQPRARACVRRRDRRRPERTPSSSRPTSPRRRARATSRSGSPSREQDASRFDYWRRTGVRRGAVAGARRARARARAGLPQLAVLARGGRAARAGRACRPGRSARARSPTRCCSTRVAATGLPVLLSSGMSSLAELDRAVERLRGRAPFAVLQCTSAYPSAPEQTGLNVLAELAERYDAPVGLSDHSGTIYGSLAAVTLGAVVVEVHVTLSREMFGPDVPSSVTTRRAASTRRPASTSSTGHGGARSTKMPRPRRQSHCGSCSRRASSRAAISRRARR